MGKTLFTLSDLFQITNHLGKQWTGQSYCPFNKNCNHFSKFFLSEILNVYPDYVSKNNKSKYFYFPSYINRFSRFGCFLSICYDPLKNLVNKNRRKEKRIKDREIFDCNKRTRHLKKNSSCSCPKQEININNNFISNHFTNLIINSNSNFRNQDASNTLLKYDDMPEVINNRIQEIPLIDLSRKENIYQSDNLGIGRFNSEQANKNQSTNLNADRVMILEENKIDNNSKTIQENNNHIFEEVGSKIKLYLSDNENNVDINIFTELIKKLNILEISIYRHIKDFKELKSIQVNNNFSNNYDLTPYKILNNTDYHKNTRIDPLINRNTSPLDNKNKNNLLDFNFNIKDITNSLEFNKISITPNNFNKFSGSIQNNRDIVIMPSNKYNDLIEILLELLSKIKKFTNDIENNLESANKIFALSSLNINKFTNDNLFVCIKLSTLLNDYYTILIKVKEIDKDMFINLKQIIKPVFEYCKNLPLEVSDLILAGRIYSDIEKF